MKVLKFEAVQILAALIRGWEEADFYQVDLSERTEVLTVQLMKFLMEL